MLQNRSRGEGTLTSRANYLAAHVKGHSATEGALSRPAGVWCWQWPLLLSKAVCNSAHFPASHFSSSLPGPRVPIPPHRWLYFLKPPVCGPTAGGKGCPDLPGHSNETNVCSEGRNGWRATQCWCHGNRTGSSEQEGQAGWGPLSPCSAASSVTSANLLSLSEPPGPLSATGEIVPHAATSSDRIPQEVMEKVLCKWWRALHKPKAIAVQIRALIVESIISGKLITKISF